MDGYVCNHQKIRKASPRKFVFLQSSSPDVRREGGGGKTNISLLESSEEWALGWKTSTIEKQNTKIRCGEEGNETFGEGCLSHSVETLCSKHINCKRKTTSTRVFGKTKLFLSTLSLYIFMLKDQE